MRYGTGPLANTPTVVKNLVIINAIMLAVKLIGNGHFLGFDLDAALGLHFFASPAFKPWQLVTYMFMHGDFWHLLMNMFGLFMLGSPLEYRWGSKRFLTFYMICGVGAGLLYAGVQAYEYQQLAAAIGPQGVAEVKVKGADMVHTGYGFQDMDMQAMLSLLFTDLVGASGAVFGVLVAFGMLYPNTELMIFPLPIPIKAKYFVLLYGAYELYEGFAMNPGDNVAHFAHIGGLVVGFITVMIWKRRLPDT